MTVSPASNGVIDDPHCGHLVQMYGADVRPLVRNVGRYLADGLVAGEGAVIIATAEHRAAFLNELADLGADRDAAQRDGRLVVLDAHETMARFLIDGQPDWERFERVAGDVLAAVRGRCPAGVRAYGEMVGVLWEAGHFAAAIRLEEFWNDLLRAGGFRLFCAYPIDVCGEAFSASEVDAVMRTHTHLVSTEPSLEPALDRAMEDVLGTCAAGVQTLAETTSRPAWAALPRAEAMILWLRHNLPAHTDAILARTRKYSRFAA